MTQRERHTPDGRPEALSSLHSSPAGAGAASLWEEWYRCASPAQRQELVALAATQGVVYAHQLGAPENGAAGGPRPLLPALLNGQTHDLEPLRAPLPAVEDAALDAAQREAVAQAVHTPDVCLIQGHPGTGKSRVIAEIIIQAAARGERVLLLAPTPAAIDRVLERLGPRESLCPVRCLGRDELPEALPPCIRRLTVAERARVFREDTLPAARAAVESALRTLEARRRQQGVWEHLEELAGRLGPCAEQVRALEEQRSCVPAAVEAELSASGTEEGSEFQARWRACLRRHEETQARMAGDLAGLRAATEKVWAEQQQRGAELGQVRPLAEARAGRRWWTASWWRALFRRDLGRRFRELQERLDALAAEDARLGQRADELARERAEAEDRFRNERSQLSLGEAARRQAGLDDQIAALRREQEQLRQKWQTDCQQLGDLTEPPAAMTPDAGRAARDAWQRRLTEDEQQVAFARQWEAAVAEALQTLPLRLAACANVAAATTMALAQDAHFGDQAGERGAFDLLVLDEAHRVTESEFLGAARRARRWVLVGEPAAEANEPAPVGRRGGAHSARSTTLRPGFFQNLWRHLHTDPGRLPYAWFWRQGGLVCRLRAVPPEHQPWVESEPVVDRPEIELRILTPPRQAPQLVEVVFPPAMTVPEAKEYLFRELEELPVQSRGHSLRWVEGPEQVVLELAPAAGDGAVPVPLAPGVWELVGRLPEEEAGRLPWYTSRLLFDRGAGWDRERAERWVEERLGVRSLGRTTLLTAPHRLRPALASFLSDLLFGDVYQAGGAPPEEAPVQFVAVPSVAGGAEARRHNEEASWGGGGSAAVATRLRSVRGGAGLEIDLGDARRLDQLPGDLRAALPRHGLVNYPEAQAVVRALEALVTDPAFRTEAEAWRRRAAGCECAGQVCDPGVRAASSCPGHCPTVAVIALYPAQAELIGLLTQRVPALAASPVEVEVGLPSAFRQRECLTALVSLTRSHSHRAVSYGEDPQDLAQAFTRATSRLYLFGDPGTLVRRCQWQGALDQLDEAAARRERGVIDQLVRYIQGHGPHPGAFRLVESGSAGALPHP